MINSFLQFVLKICEKKLNERLMQKPFMDNYSSLFFSGRRPPGENLIIRRSIDPIKTSLR